VAEANHGAPFDSRRSKNPPKSFHHTKLLTNRGKALFPDLLAHRPEPPVGLAEGEEETDAVVALLSSSDWAFDVMLDLTWLFGFRIVTEA